MSSFQQYLTNKRQSEVTHELSKSQRVQDFDLCRCCIYEIRDRILTCDEKWILYDNCKRSTQWLNPDDDLRGFPESKLQKQKIKVTFTLSAIGIIHYRFLGSNQSITLEVYSQQLDEIRIQLTNVRPAMVNR